MVKKMDIYFYQIVYHFENTHLLYIVFSKVFQKSITNIILKIVKSKIFVLYWGKMLLVKFYVDTVLGTNINDIEIQAEAI